VKELEPGLSADLLEGQESLKDPCADTPHNPAQGAPYALPGPQVEPAAAFWLVNGHLRSPTLNEVRARVGTPPPFPDDPAELERQIAELQDLASRRDDPLPEDGLSDFINLQDPPFGAIFNASKERTQFRVDFVKRQDSRISRLPKTLVLTGRELARMFEIETPGLLHRHFVNWALFQRPDVSPPRQARVWAALDLAIYAALSAAWYYKWADPETRYVQRPWEYDPSLEVLYDREVAEDGDGDGPPRPCPCPSPGTPRHPAYPSGHSTYSAAASRLLMYFFRDDYSQKQLQKLADNIGEARLWAGVHWRSDHEFGQRVGNAVAEAIIDQLLSDCVPPISDVPCQKLQGQDPPTPDEVQELIGLRIASPCPDANVQDRIVPRDQAPKALTVT
jgi:hypothetical protein